MTSTCWAVTWPAKPELPPNAEHQIFRSLSQRRIPIMTPGQIDKSWQSFIHAPYDQSGFNLVVMPFHVATPADKKTDAIAQAMAFLISLDQDWAPGNYCSRHAYFVFKRDAQAVASLKKQYQTDGMVELAKDWRATHVLGGTLSHIAAGWSMTVTLYNPLGIKIWEFTSPRSSTPWEMLGECSSQLMTRLDTAPSPALRHFLAMPRGRNLASLELLGQAAFQEEKSPQEFELYDQILAGDPSFAEVRYWYHNQKQWQTGNRKEYALNEAMALESRLVEPGLSDFQPENCADPKLAARYPAWIAAAREMLGNEHPMILKYELETVTPAMVDTRAALVNRGISVADRYPNDRWLLIHLSQALQQTPWEVGGPDIDLAGSLAWAGFNNRALPSIGHREEEITEVFNAAFGLGYHDMTLPLLSLGRMSPQEYGEKYVEAFWCQGQYEKLIRFYFHRQLPESDKAMVSRRAGPAAFNMGDILSYEKILKENAADVEACHATQVAKYSLDWLRKEKLSPPPEPGAICGGWWYLPYIQRMLWDQRQGGQVYREEIERFARENPLDREAWIAQDAYERKTPSPWAADFYFMLSYLYPTDPWVGDLAGAFTARGGNLRNRSTLSQLQSEFKTLHHNAWRKLSQNALEIEVHRVKVRMPAWRLVSVMAEAMEHPVSGETMALLEDFRDLSVLTRQTKALHVANGLYRRYEIHGDTKKDNATSQPAPGSL